MWIDSGFLSEGSQFKLALLRTLCCSLHFFSFQKLKNKKSLSLSTEWCKKGWTRIKLFLRERIIPRLVKGALSRYSVIFLRHFVVGKNNGGCASFQTKRAQQVSCLSIIVVYIVLCSKIYATAPESLKDRDSWTIVGPRQLKFDPWSSTLKPVLDSMILSPFSGQICLFVFTFLIISRIPTSFERGITLQG